LNNWSDSAEGDDSQVEESPLTAGSNANAVLSNGIVAAPGRAMPSKLGVLNKSDAEQNKFAKVEAVELLLFLFRLIAGWRSSRQSEYEAVENRAMDWIGDAISGTFPSVTKIPCRRHATNAAPPSTLRKVMVAIRPIS
jgi:hypothetical protein